MKMTDEPDLTLEEISELVETINDWQCLGGGTYCGKNNTVYITADKPGFPNFGYRSIKIELMGRWTKLGHVKGKEVRPVYNRIVELHKKYGSKKQREANEKRNKFLREIRHIRK